MIADGFDVAVSATVLGMWRLGADFHLRSVVHIRHVGAAFVNDLEG
jgi:hypothetical protein